MGVLDKLTKAYLGGKFEPNKEKTKVAKDKLQEVGTWDGFKATPEYKSLGALDKVSVGKFYENKLTNNAQFKALPQNQQEGYLTAFRESAKKDVQSTKIKDTASLWPGLKALELGHKGVNLLADKVIAPQTPVTAEESNWNLWGHRLPREVVAEFTRGLSPYWILGTAGAGTVAKTVGKPLVKGIAKVGGKALPAVVKEGWKRFMTTGKGRPIAYQLMKKRNLLGKAKGAREAEKVALILTKKENGKVLSSSEQTYLGRIFRNEIDTSGKLSRLTESVEQAQKVAKNAEVAVAFDPEVAALQKRLSSLNKKLGSKANIAESKVGQVFETKPGNIEKVTGVKQLTGKRGKPIQKFDLISEPVAPVESVGSRVLPTDIADGEDVLRAVKGIGKNKTLTKAPAVERKALLAQRKGVAKQLQKRVIDIETDVRASYDVFDKTFVDKITNNPRYKELKSISDKGRAIQDKWSQALIDSGVPGEEAAAAIKANMSSYMHRQYLQHLKKGKSFWTKDGLTLRLDILKKRKNLTEAVRKKLGEIKAPAYPTATAVSKISKITENAKLFNAVAANSEWVADTNVTGKMFQMPESKMYGKLSGKFVNKAIAADIQGIVKAPEAGFKIVGAYNKALGAWKYGKVILNPSTHMRNMFSNSMLLDFSGINHLQQARMMPGVMKDYMSKGKMYNLALDHGAIGGEFVGTEVAALRDTYMKTTGSHFERLLGKIKKPFRSAAKVYQAEEQVAKMVKFTDVYNKTGNATEAAKQAQKWLFDYSNIPEFMNIAKGIAPFATFTYKALPRVAETMVNNPLKIYKYHNLFRSMNEGSRKLVGLSPEEYAREKDALPPWILKDIGGVPSTLLLPTRDKHGRTQFLNLEYILPIGMAPEIMEKGLLKGFVGNPFFNTLASLQKDKDFKGQQITPLEGTKAENLKAQFQHTYRQAVPSLTPGIPGLTKGGYSFEKIMAAYKKIPDQSSGIVRSLPTALSDTIMGLKITPVDSKKSKMFKQYNKIKRMNAVKKEIGKWNRKYIDKDKRDKQIQILFKKLQKISKEK